VLSPVIGFLATVALEKLASQELDASAEASGPHVFAVRFSTVRRRHLRVHRNPSNVRDDGQRPSEQDGMHAMYGDLGCKKTEIFLIRGLDTISENKN